MYFRVFRTSKRLYSHMDVHKNLTIVCDLCGSIFNTRIGLKQHKKFVHKVTILNGLDVNIEYETTRTPSYVHRYPLVPSVYKFP